MKQLTTIPAANPGNDLKFRVTTSKDDFNLARDDFNIVIKNQYGRVVARILKNDCFYDSEGRWYFNVENNLAKFDANGNPVDSGIAAGDIATKDADAVEGNFAAFDANGNPVDSGHKHSDYKTKQTAVTDADATTSGNDTTFVDSVTQDANGEISVHKKTVPNVSASTSGAGGTNGLMLATDKEKLDGLLECSDSDIDSIFA